MIHNDHVMMREYEFGVICTIKILLYDVVTKLIWTLDGVNWQSTCGKVIGEHGRPSAYCWKNTNALAMEKV